MDILIKKQRPWKFDVVTRQINKYTVNQSEQIDANEKGNPRLLLIGMRQSFVLNLKRQIFDFKDKFQFETKIIINTNQIILVISLINKCSFQK